MVLRLTLTTAELVGENPAEWQGLEQLVQFGAVDERPGDGGVAAPASDDSAQGAAPGGRSADATGRAISEKPTI